MIILFRFCWGAASPAKAFKSAEARGLFTEYLKRIGRFTKAGESSADLKAPDKTRAIRWFCDLSKGAKAFSSVELARELEQIRGSGRDWEILIGPADGFTAADIERWKPERLWSFGPLTLPHELAAVVAAEQVYRACTILANQPYHSGH